MNLRVINAVTMGLMALEPPNMLNRVEVSVNTLGYTTVLIEVLRGVQKYTYESTPRYSMGEEPNAGDLERMSNKISSYCHALGAI